MKKLLFLLLAFTAVFFIACGDDDDSGSGTKTSSVSVDTIRDVSLMFTACGLDDPSSLNEDIYFVYNLLKIDDNSDIGKGNGFIPADKLKKYLNEVFECSESSKTCGEFASCLKIELTDESCSEYTYTASCDGNKLIKCNWLGNVIKIDCSAQMDETCKVDEDGEADCMDAVEDECDDETYVPSCEGDSVKYCMFGRIVKADCSLNGSTCKVIDEDGRTDAVCEPDPSWPDCDEQTYEKGCDGKYTLSCQRGKVVRNDCEKLVGAGFICKENATMTEAFMFAGCVHSDVAGNCTKEPVCNGNVIEYCVNGESKTYDCVANGYAACSTEKTEGESGEIKDLALCTF